MFDRSSIELRFVFDRTSLWYRLESKEVTKVKRKRSSHVPPKFLPSTSHFLILGKGREKGSKKEKKSVREEDENTMLFGINICYLPR